MSSHELEENSFHRSSGVPWELLFLPVMEVTAPDLPFGFLWEIALSAGSTSYFAIRRTWNGRIVNCRGLFPWLSSAICKEYSEGSWHPGSWAVALYRYINETSAGKLAI
jgi:hypothetical protein